MVCDEIDPEINYNRNVNQTNQSHLLVVSHVIPVMTDQTHDSQDTDYGKPFPFHEYMKSRKNNNSNPSRIKSK